jgi:hypothetical protein
MGIHLTAKRLDIKSLTHPTSISPTILRQTRIPRSVDLSVALPTRLSNGVTNE